MGSLQALIESLWRLKAVHSCVQRHMWVFEFCELCHNHWSWWASHSSYRLYDIIPIRENILGICCICEGYSTADTWTWEPLAKYSKASQRLIPLNSIFQWSLGDYTARWLVHRSKFWPVDKWTSHGMWLSLLHQTLCFCYPFPSHPQVLSITHKSYQPTMGQ